MDYDFERIRTNLGVEALMAGAVPDKMLQVGGGESKAVDAIEFGPFSLHVTERRLFRQGEPISIGSRALDILIALGENAGNVVSQQQLVNRVWGLTIVEESSLRVHIAKLRKALNDGEGGRYVVNVTGRGYSLAAPVHKSFAASSEALFPETSELSDLRCRLPTVVGREGDVSAVLKLLQVHRFVTLHGTGGIGKTTVSIAVALQAAPMFANGVRFLDLGLGRGLSSAIEELAAMLDLSPSADEPMLEILEHLCDKRMLLVFDCCEHVIESAASLAEAIFRAAPGVAILATSREALRADGEHVYRLPPLAVPGEEDTLNPETIWTYPSARLFLDRAAAAGYRQELSDADARIVGLICRKVDGIALALELAAGRVGAHGLAGTASLLGSDLNLLWQGKRTALPRQRTMSATLDWSYDLLTDVEKAVFRRLSVFAGAFDIGAVKAIFSTEVEFTNEEVVEAFGQLVAKSLVAATTGERMHYRLQDTTRAYAWVKLSEAGETSMAPRGHSAT